MPFSKQKAERVIRFIERVCFIPSGKGVGTPFKLREWQKNIVRELFGRVTEKDVRQYSNAYISFARRNGKTALTAAIALYMTFGDGEINGLVNCCANDQEQAGLLYKYASDMINLSPVLKARAKLVPHRKKIIDKKTGSILQALSSESTTKLGMNSSCVIFDELAFTTNRELYDVMTTSIGSREQPLIITITTASWFQHSVGKELYDYAKDLEKGKITDPTFYHFIAEADPGDDIFDPATWAKANPALNDFRSLKELSDFAERAKNRPHLANQFRIFYLNQWVAQETRWLDLRRWDESAGDIDLTELEGQPCYAGLDLSTTTDVTALVLVFPRPDGTYKVLPHFFLPGADLADRCNRDKVPYDQWNQQGLVTLTEGDVVDYEFVISTLKDLADRYDIREVAFDRWGAARISQQLSNDGLVMVPFGQGFGSMSAPTKELLSLVLQKRLHHAGNPVLRWMADCMTVKGDPAGNIKPVKPEQHKESKRIDGIVALIMALGRATLHQQTPTDICWALS